MNEDFVTYEQAVKLKELGFDWECQAYFEDYVDELNRHHRKFRFNAVANDMLHKDFCSAPTLAQAQKWFRKEHGIIITIGFYRYSETNYAYGYDIKQIDNERVMVGGDTSAYEQALSASIDRALKILTQKLLESL